MRIGGWNDTYFKHYSETHYINIWLKAVEVISSIDNPYIIDIGCGPGQFANLLFDKNLINYKGIDFNKEAIKIAKIRNDKYRNLFLVEDVHKSSLFQSEYNFVVIFEVLEHIDNDLSIIRNVKEGSNILFSVPNFYSPGHVRWFNSQQDRYGRELKIDNIFIFPIGGNNKIYLVHGKK